MEKIDSQKKQYKKAIEALEEVLKKEKSDIIRDSAIKRFEFCFDLSWKLIKSFLQEEKGITCNSPKDCFRLAYQNNIIEYDEFWLEITDHRNLAIHTYGEKMANDLFRKLPKILKYFQTLEKKII